MHVSISHYYNPQPPAYKVFNVGSGNQAIKGAVDMDESRQPMGECRRSQEGLNLLSPSGSWLVQIPQPTTCTEQPLNHNAYSNQANAQASICPSTYYALTARFKDSTLTEVFMTENCIKHLKALITVFYLQWLPKICSSESAFTAFWPRINMVTMRIYYIKY